MSDEQHEINEEQPSEDGGGKRTRLDLLKLAGAAAGGAVGAKMLAPSAAEATNGDPLKVGDLTNSAAAQTILTSSVAFGPHPANPLDGAFRVNAANADYAIYGVGGSYGVAGYGPGGVLGLGTVGGVFAGSAVAVNLDPQSWVGPPELVNDPPNNPPIQAFQGDLAVDANGVLWFCIVGGTGPAATWIRLSNPKGAIVTLPAPVRVINTTDGTGGITGPLVPGATAHTTTSLIGVAGIPATAVGIVGTLAIAGVNGALLNGFGFSTIYPAGVSTPGTSSISAGAGCFAISNAVTVAFGTGANAGKLSIVWAGGGPVPNAHAFLDVAGYF